ncbi:MAG: hypothetical protein Q8O03_01730 [Nanoarchaeota archaeon]|nr:hypothetical protein [Nanoarchaeota archaeon]
MKELEKKVIKDLIDFYEFYIDGAGVKILKAKAEEIQSKYIAASPILSEKVYKLITGLVDFYVNTRIKAPSKEEAKKILEELYKLERS